MSLFTDVCEEKISEIIKLADNKSIWIYGAGVRGKILKDILIKHNINLSGFIDRNAKSIKDIDGFLVTSISDINPVKDYIIVSLRDVDYKVMELIENNGFAKKDYYYIAAGVGCLDEYVIFNEEDVEYKGCKIGKYTYGYQRFLESAPIAESIGRFCSINTTARTWSNHPTDYVTTHPILDHPIFYSWEKSWLRDELISRYGTYFSNAFFENSALRKNSPVIIGNDVWIGANAVILPGVNIGNGAIIAAGAIVNKDVPDYAIVGGVPAKIIKYRFSDDIIKSLLKMQWWNWDINEIEANIELFYQPEVFVNQ